MDYHPERFPIPSAWIDYDGPLVLLDFDKDGKLIGIEVIA